MVERREDRYPNHYRESLDLPRVNISLPVRNMLDKGFEPPPTDLLPSKRKLLGLIGKRGFNPTPEEALEIYHLGKQERYTLTGVMVARFVDVAIKSRPQAEPYGLVGFPINHSTWKEDEKAELKVIKWLAVPEPFRLLDIHMTRTLGTAYSAWIRNMAKFSKEQPKHPDSQVYKRLKQWTDFYHRFLPLTPEGSVDQGEDIGTTFNPVFTESGTGILTAVRFMTSMLRVIPQVLERDIPWQEITPDLLTQTAKNTYPLLAKNAMLPFDAQSIVHDVLSNEALFYDDSFCFGRDRENYPYHRGIFDPSRFVAKKVTNGHRIDMRDDTLMWTEYYAGRTKTSGQKATIGCPAMVDVDGTGSSVKKLWDWHVDIGDKLYHDLWGSWFEPQAANQARINLIRKVAHEKGMLVMGLDF